MSGWLKPATDLIIVGSKVEALEKRLSSVQADLKETLSKLTEAMNSLQTKMALLEQSIGHKIENAAMEAKAQAKETSFDLLSSNLTNFAERLVKLEQAISGKPRDNGTGPALPPPT